MASAEDFFSKIPVIGGFFESDAQKGLLDQYKKMQQQYAAYRPVAQGAIMGGLQNALSPGLLGPVNAQLTKMYGSGAAMDPSALLRDPLAASQQQQASLARDQHSQQLLAQANRRDQINQQMRQSFMERSRMGIPQVAPLPFSGVGRS